MEINPNFRGMKGEGVKKKKKKREEDAFDLAENRSQALEILCPNI